MSERGERCSTCRFWRKELDADESNVSTEPLGRCHRSPPTLFPSLLEGQNYDAFYMATRWPLTAGDEWCGEWSPVGVRPAEFPVVMVIEDVSRWLGSLNTRVKKMMARGEIPYRTLPTGETVFDRAELAEWFAGLKNLPTPVDIPESGVQDT